MEDQELIDYCHQKLVWMIEHPGICIFFNGAYIHANQVRYVEGLGLVIAGGNTAIPEKP